MSEAKRGSLLPQTSLCFQQRQLRLSWESLTDSSLYASLLYDSYHTTEALVLCSSSPSYSRGKKNTFLPFCIQTRVCHSPHVWRRNENHQNEIKKRKTIKVNKRKAHLEYHHSYQLNWPMWWLLVQMAVKMTHSYGKLHE